MTAITDMQSSERFWFLYEGNSPLSVIAGHISVAVADAAALSPLPQRHSTFTSCTTQHMSCNVMQSEKKK